MHVGRNHDGRSAVVVRMKRRTATLMLRTATCQYRHSFIATRGFEGMGLGIYWLYCQAAERICLVRHNSVVACWNVLFFFLSLGGSGQGCLYRP